MKPVIINAPVFQVGWPGTVAALLIVGRQIASASSGRCVLMPLRMRLSQHLDDFSPAPPGPVRTTWSARV